MGRNTIWCLIKHVTRLSLISLAVAWGFDLLFWGKAPGISFFIFVILVLLAGALVTWWEGFKPALSSLVLLVPVFFFGAITFIRSEPFTFFVSFLLVLSCLAILTMTWRGGKWMHYGLVDYFMGTFRLAGSALSRPVLMFIKRRLPVTMVDSPSVETSPAGVAEAAPEILTAAAEQRQMTASFPNNHTAGKRQAVSILRGVLLAIPVIAVLAALLASADPIFSKDLDVFLKIFRIQNLGEYIFRGIYILAGAYLLAGLYLHAIGPSQDEKVLGQGNSWLKPFLGWTEAGIVLGAVDLLFAFFVAIQARYFFGGQANITSSGYTFAEYARRGFNELVAVAVISLVLILVLSSVTRRETKTQRRVFTVLEVGLVVLVGVILVSAYQRLLLYEAAYGFSRIRIYTHVLMAWLGILLAGVAVLDLASNLRRFALTALVVCLGFGVTLSLLNVDDFIVRQNINRAQSGSELDSGYLVSLSDDAVPALVASFDNQSLPAALHDQVGAILSCRAAAINQRPEASAWQSFVVSRSRARTLVDQYQNVLKAYPVTIMEDGSWQVSVGAAMQSCYEYNGID